MAHLAQAYAGAEQIEQGRVWFDKALSEGRSFDAELKARQLLPQLGDAQSG